MQFHPTRSDFLLSGSTDGLINIYNIFVKDEDDAILQTVNHGSSISHANLLDNSTFFALSHDEVFSVHPLDEEEKYESSVEFGDLRALFDCEYVIDVLSSRESTAMVCTGSHRCGVTCFAPGKRL